ncbi:MAG TPA: selenocysteine-specific translation elongation factor [Pseudonocardiaceae bacterium]|nr:selenocysteine-specific translation elongation factor [Pseudonocardiaceae bacterium]
MHVIATAGHVDHGKSTLVRALTGMEPDRWSEERRRGMTLDLGFVWTDLPGAGTVAFVDVPGHERFVTTMLAGVGPVPAVLVVVAADEGWRAQTAEHVDILSSLGVRHGLLVVTRADLADPAAALADARARLDRTSLAGCDAVAVSAVTGAGMAELRAALVRLVTGLPQAPTTGRVRLFVDRAFTIRGSGTVVTGTLAAGTLAQGDQLQFTRSDIRTRIRGLHALGTAAESVSAVARVAVNLRGVPVDEITRGDALVTPDAWVLTDEVDVRLLDIGPADLPGDLVLHIGSAAVPCRIRPLGEDTGRVRLAARQPLRPGDRAVLREPSSRLATGAVVLDVDPPALRRRGAARARAVALEALAGDRPDVLAEVARRGSVTRARLAALGILDVPEPLPAGLLAFGEHVVHPDRWRHWQAELARVVDEHHATAPLEPGLPARSAQHLLGVPDLRLVDELVREASGKLVAREGRIARPGTGPAFSDAVRQALDAVRDRLAADPFDAPDVPELAAAGLTTSVLAAAARSGLVLRLPGDVILHPSAPDAAAAAIAALPQPFTLSEARQALGTTRRIAVPLLEYLDTIGRTVRVDATRRRVTDVPTAQR